jgi:6-phosphogluconate dehydrogenase
MRIGFVGLGKMGKWMVRRLIKNGHEVVAYNRSKGPIEEVMADGAIGAYTLQELTQKFEGRKIIWLMVPNANVESVLKELLPLMGKGDILIDGGNSNYHKTLARHEEISKLGIHFMDIGVSGGLVASKLGYCMMIGGDKQIFQELEPAIKSMCVEDGYLHVGPIGAGHFVKMTHNAIEYGMMQAIGEGFELLEKSPYKDLDFAKIAHLWNHGSIIRGFLMEMIENAFQKDGRLDKIRGFIDDNGEGKWAAEEALNFRVPFTVNTFALYERYRSRSDNTMSDKVVAAIRDEFGGHGVKTKSDSQ